MDFLNSIGNSFQDFGNQINNEVIKPAENTLDPTKNGISQTILNDPNIKKITNDPLIKTITKDINTTNLNNQLHSIFNNPSNVLHITDPITKGFVNGFDPTKNGVANLILNDPNIKKITDDPNIRRALRTKPTSIDDALKQIKDAFDPKKNGVADGFQKDIIDGFQTKVIDGFQKDVIDGFQKDIINPTKGIIDNIGDTLNSLGGGGARTQTPTGGDYTIYIIIGAVLVGMYAFLPNKKPVNNKI